MAVLLAACLALQSTLARASVIVQVAPVSGVSGSAAAAAGAAIPLRATRAALRTPLSGTTLIPALPAVSAPVPLTLDNSLPRAIRPAAQASAALPAPATAAKPAADPASRPATARSRPASGGTAPLDQAQSRSRISLRLGRVAGEIARGRAGLDNLPAEAARGAAEAQIARLTGRSVISRAGSTPVPAARPIAAATPRHGLARPQAAADSPGLSRAGTKDAAPAKPAALEKAGRKGFLGRIGDFFRARTTVFRDPARNKAFWRIFLGEQIYMVGFQMYVVALPYLIQSFTRNTLKENGRLAGTTPEALTELVRQNRSLARIAHWVSQAVSYVAIPLFAKGQEGPRKWLVRSALIRMAVLAGIPAIFFFSGVFSARTALFVLLGLIGAQSFFQGLYVTMMGGSIARILGDKSVKPSERLRANSIRSLGSALISILAPAIAGKIAGIKDLFGKMGAGSAVIYGIYAAAVGLAGLVFATIRILAEKRPAAPGMEDAASLDDTPAIKGLGSVLKGVWVSMREGLKLVMKSRFLRTLLLLNLIMSLFSDPLIFNVLPEFVGAVLKASPGAMDGILGVPVLGWFMDGLISTPMGFFGMLVMFGSIGSVLATILVNPLRAVFKKLGFRTEESLTIPFYAVSFVQVLAFWAMIHSPSFWGVLFLYALQSLSAGFVGLVMTGIYQKNISKYSSKQMNRVLAANSFLGILAAIAATYIYGFVLKGIPIATSLMIAGVAMTVLGVLQIASPWMYFTKEERKGAGRKPPSLRRRGQEHRPPDTGRGPDGHGHMPKTSGPLRADS
ncbi:MAG: hypothetical protein ABII00_01460 [Elusimicrobiota bacterium]